MEEPKYTLIAKDYLDLWKQFQEDADKVKDKLWTITSWLYALMGGLMAFLLDRQNFDKILILFGASTGVLLSLYTWYMIKEFGIHIQNYWDRANWIKDHKIEGLTKIPGLNNNDNNDKPKDNGEKENATNDKPKDTDEKEDDEQGNDTAKKLPKFARRLVYLAIGYGLAFVLLALYLMLFPPPPIKPS